MILQIDDWKFDIDMTTTMEYSAGELAEHCDCAYCRNFYATVDDTYPKLRPFLAQFGVEVEAPDEMMPYTPTYIENWYVVSGTILQNGRQPIVVDGVNVLPLSAEKALMNTACPKPYFVLSVGTMDLPWILDEPMEEVVSPANFPAFLKRMWDKLLMKQPKSQQKS